MSEPETRVEEQVIEQEPSRPDFLKAKYKTVEDQAKAYLEIEKMLGQAPESYDLNDFADYIDIESDYGKQIAQIAKENRLTQEGLSKLLKPLKDYHQSLTPNFEEELKKLGDKPKERLEKISNWAANNLSEKALETIGKVAQTAEVIELLDEIRRSSTANSVPIANSQKEVLTVEKVRQEMIDNFNKYRNDATYRAEITAKLKAALGEE